MNDVTRFKNDLIERIREKNISDDVTVKLSKDDIKKQFNKERLSGSLIDKIKKEFKKSGFDVKDNCTSTVCVVVPKEKINKNVLTGKELFED